MSGRVVVVGSSNTDMVVQVPKLPIPGQTVLGKDLVVAAGGKGANQAVAAARLGADVTLVARVGMDLFGQQSLESFRQEKIRTEYIFREEGTPSGVALIMVGEGGENMIAVAPGANAKLTPADIDRAAQPIREADIVLFQLETPLETIRYAVRMAREAGARVILNPAPGRSLGAEVLREVSILTPNVSETEILTGTKVEGISAARDAARQLQSLGVGAVVITMGREGACCLSESGFQEVPGWKLVAKDTTAAGDAFNGALACALAEGEGLDRAVNFANAVAALSVTRLGAQPSLPTRQEVNQWMKSIE